MPRLSPAPSAVTGLLLAAATSCSGSGGSTPIGGSNVPPELLACRARVDSPSSFAEIALRTAQNLGTRRVADRSGTERHARLHPDGNTVVFSRERPSGDLHAQELHVAAIDGATSELRLTQNNSRDGEPCWSPDGSQILFTTERDGAAALWLMKPDGSDQRRLLAPPAGESDGQADWSRASGTIVFSRRDALGRHRLHTASGSGTAVTPLTDGGVGTAAGDGDHAPTFSPDGGTIAFVRRAGTDSATLCYVSVATHAVTPRLAVTGELDLPRFSPAADRLFLGIAEPGLGRASLRLATLPLTTGAPTLVWPDERWFLTGIDLLPALPGAPTASQNRVLDVTRAEVQLAFGGNLFGAKEQLTAADGDELLVGTATSNNHQVAGINCRFDLPVASAADVVELRVRAVARVLRVGGDTALRMSIYNPVDERFDTAVEIEPADTGAVTLTFRTSSLRHVTREKQLRVTVVGEVAAGPPTELRVDLVEVEVVGALTPP